ncbi:MAG: hypothetical protein RJA70_4623 [Pseudomonadota bacterium]|jgi:4-alpha-glucanotransferase
MLFERESGVLLHPSSLPGPFGVGEIGPEAVRWVEQLEQMHQALWQVLPLTPPGTAASPYQGRSSFAGDTNLLSLELLAQQGLLSIDDLDAAKVPEGPVNYDALASSRGALLRRAAVQFLADLGGEEGDLFEEFCTRQNYWLHDYARYQAIKNARAGDDWLSWPAELRERRPSALETVDFELANAIRVEKALQYLFEGQWQYVRREAHRRQIRIVGDLPIFVALDSADVWASQHLFRLNELGQPTVVAGVPPDYFSNDGQRWGNPLFDWEAHELEGYSWWSRRLRRTLEMTDVTRIDHFRGFAACWEIPAHEPTAIRGQWVPAPGRALLEAMQRDLGTELPIIAEDLGIITDDVVELREAFQLPTMRVLQFSFTGEAKLLPSAYPENSVVYTGTHDNDTIVGWYAGKVEDNSTLSVTELEAERDRVRRYYETDGSHMHFTAIRGVMATRASAAIFPAQDIMGLGSEARMNTPGTVGPHNWSWRFKWEQLSSSAIATVRAITLEAGRNPRLR